MYLFYNVNNVIHGLVVDGIFGSKTTAAVRDFQSNNGLSVDGIVGPNTWRTLLTLPQYPILRLNFRGNYVRFLQKLLESKFIPVGTIDGIFGPDTESAVQTFQERNNLVVDGIVGPNTWATITNLQ